MNMNKAFLVLVLMILGHLIADYPLQGWLAQAKQKSYWENQDKKYKHDYIPALICHATMWSIIVFTPIIYFSWDKLGVWWLLLPINILCHYFVDNEKANKKSINLRQDQLCHLLQIINTWVLWLINVGCVI